MKGWIAIVACVLFMLLPTFARAEVVNPLPEDSNWPHVSLIVSDNWQADPFQRQLVVDMQAEQRTSGGVHWHLYTTSNPIFKARLAHRVQAVPAVIAQTADGNIPEPSVDIAVGAGCRGWFAKRAFLRLRRGIHAAVAPLAVKVNIAPADRPTDTACKSGMCPLTPRPVTRPIATKPGDAKPGDAEPGKLFPIFKGRGGCVDGNCANTNVDVSVPVETSLPDQQVIVQVPTETPPQEPAKTEFPWLPAILLAAFTAVFYYRVVEA